MREEKLRRWQLAACFHSAPCCQTGGWDCDFHRIPPWFWATVDLRGAGHESASTLIADRTYNSSVSRLERFTTRRLCLCFYVNDNAFVGLIAILQHPLSPGGETRLPWRHGSVNVTPWKSLLESTRRNTLLQCWFLLLALASMLANQATDANSKRLGRGGATDAAVLTRWCVRRLASPPAPGSIWGWLPRSLCAHPLRLLTHKWYQNPPCWAIRRSWRSERGCARHAHVSAYAEAENFVLEIQSVTFYGMY